MSDITYERAWLTELSKFKAKNYVNSFEIEAN